MTTPAGNLVGDAHINITGNTDPAARALRDFSRSADGRLRDLRGRFVSESRLMGTAFNRTALGGDRFKESLGSLKAAAIQLSPALIPIAAQALPIAANVGAASAAVGAFALAAAGQVTALSEASDAEKKYQDAVQQHGAASKQAAEAQNAYVQQVAKMPPATRTAAAALSSLKDQYRAWSDSLASSTMPVATKAMQAFAALFPKLTPVVQGAGTQLNRFVTIAAGIAASPGLDALMSRFAEFSTEVLTKANDALVHFTRTLNTGKISGGVSQFMEYARANGPLVKDTLEKVGQALLNVMQAASNVGPGLLTVVNAFAGLVAAVPPGVITTLLQLSLAMKAVRIAAAAMALTSAAVTAFTASVGAMRLAAAGATGVLPRLAAAFAAMSRSAKVAVAGTGIGLLLIAMAKLSSLGKTAAPDVDKLSMSLRKLADTGKFSGELKATFGSVDGLVAKIKLLNKETAKSKETAFGFRIPGLDDLADKVAGSINDMTKGEKSLSALKGDFTSLDKAMAGLVSAGYGKQAAKDFDAIKEAALKQGHSLKEVNALFPAYKSAVADAQFEQQLAAQSMGLFGQQAQATSAKLAEQKQSADGLRQAIQALNDVQRAGLGGMIGFEAAIDAASKAARENAGVLSMHNGQLSLNTDKQRAAAQALSDLASKTDEAAAANRESTGSWEGSIGIYERGRQQLIRNATAMGLTKDEAAALADQILKTPNKTAMLKADITDWKTKISEADKQLKTAKGDKKAKLTADIADWKAKVAAAELQLKGAKADKRAKLTADIADWRSKVASAEVQLRTAKGEKKAKLTANIADWQKKIAAAQAQINKLPASKTTRLITWKITNIQTNYVNSASKKGSVHDAVGATGGLYTGVDFKFRGKGYAEGGKVNGPGTPTSDSVFAPWLSKDEFVVNAKQTAKNLPLLVAINNGTLDTGGLAGGSMAGAGADVASGLASGMTNGTGMVLAAARAMAAAVTKGVKDELQIASPSRKMKALATDVGKGFISGLTGSQAKIKSVSKDLANDVRNAFSGRKESALIGLINKDTNKLLSLANKRDAIEKKIAEANKFASDTASQARATGSLSSIVQQDAYSPQYVKGQMQASLKQIKAFTANVQKLQKKGLNKDLLKQILEMGPEQGAAFAASLAGADKATIKQYNSLNTQINKESSKLGKTGADLLYDSGKNAGKGFLTGLKAQQKDIEKLMLNIAKGMQKAIKNALGIKSPSRVMDVIGRMSMLGLEGGIIRRVPAVRTVMQKVAGVMTSGVPSTLPIATNARNVAARAVSSTRRSTAAAGTVIHEHHYHFTNNGPIGSPMQLDNWLMGSVNRLAGQGRLRRLVETGGTRT